MLVAREESCAVNVSGGLMRKDVTLLLLHLLRAGSVCNCRVVRTLHDGSGGIFRLGTNALCPLLRSLRDGNCMVSCRSTSSKGGHECCRLARTNQRRSSRGGRR